MQLIINYISEYIELVNSDPLYSIVNASGLLQQKYSNVGKPVNKKA